MTGFLSRWVLALGLLVATYNPTPWSYVAWVQQNYRTQTAISVLVGLLLLTGYIIYVRATLRSIGLFGMALVTAIVAAGVWVLTDQGYVSLDSPDVRTWISLAGLSFVLGVGLSWSHVRRAIAGQFDVDGSDD